MRHSTSGLLMFMLYVLAASAFGSSGISDEITYIENTSLSSKQFLAWNNTCARKKMAEQRETYKGREIVVRTGEDAPAEGAAGLEGAGAGRAGGEAVDVRIDGKNVFVIKNSSGSYIASGFAFDPQPSPMDLARKIIDYREAGR
ncbi:MAG TPA: tyrosinase family oxidase copper chaperone [Nitrosospira sp.]|nr:tyrosinase family oxidase copper chaperone [Nitrosospira sp.]